jgi:hypothetical protein
MKCALKVFAVVGGAITVSVAVAAIPGNEFALVTVPELLR